MYVYTEPVYPRQSAEKAWKQVYNLGLVLNFGAFVITATNFASRMSSTYVDYFTNSNFELTASLRAILTSCPTTTRSYTQNGMSVTSALDVGSCPFAFLTTTNSILSIIVMHALLIVCDFLSKTLFNMNVRHMRVRALHIPATTILVLATWVLSVIVIALIAVTSSSRNFVQSYVGSCALSYQNNNKTAFLASENDSNTVFGTNFDLILAATCINLIFLFFAFIYFMADAIRAENAVMSKEHFPWEKGFLCRPSKPALVAWTLWRREQERAIKEGKPRPDVTAAEAIATAEEEDKIRRQLVLQDQLAANAAARRVHRGRYPIAAQGTAGMPGYTSAPQQQQQQRRGGAVKELPDNAGSADQWDDNGAAALGDEYEYAAEEQDGVGADYLYQPTTRRRHHHRRKEREALAPPEEEVYEAAPPVEGERRRRRRKKERVYTDDGGVNGAPADDRMQASSPHREYAAVPMPPVAGDDA